MRIFVASVDLGIGFTLLARTNSVNLGWDHQQAPRGQQEHPSADRPGQSGWRRRGYAWFNTAYLGTYHQLCLRKRHELHRIIFAMAAATQLNTLRRDLAYMTLMLIMQ